MNEKTVEHVHRYERPNAEALPFTVGDQVQFVGHYHWCGETTHGAVGQVTEVIRYPADVVAGGAIYMVQRTADGEPYGSKVPMTSPDLAAP